MPFFSIKYRYRQQSTHMEFMKNRNSWIDAWGEWISFGTGILEDKRKIEKEIREGFLAEWRTHFIEQDS